jgi:hypothetical protein
VGIDRPILVALGNPRPGVETDFAARPPVIYVHVTYDPNWAAASGAAPRHDGAVYAALVDTGAENTSVDAQIAATIGAPQVGTGIVHAMNGRHNAVSMVDLQIFLPSPNIVFAAKAAVMDFRADGQTFDLILGRTFLANCEFSLDGPRAAYSLVWRG